MDVILLERMRNLGSLGDKVKVKSGYARNYLVPKGKAVYATPINITKFEAMRADLEKAEAITLGEAKKREQTLLGLTINIPAKSGEEGKLFGSIGTRDISDAITNLGVAVNKNEVQLPAGALRYTGEYEIVIILHTDVNPVVKVNIVPEAL